MLTGGLSRTVFLKTLLLVQDGLTATDDSNEVISFLEKVVDTGESRCLRSKRPGQTQCRFQEANGPVKRHNRLSGYSH